MNKETTEEKKVTWKEELLQERPVIAAVVVGADVVDVVVLASTWSSSYSWL